MIYQKYELYREGLAILILMRENWSEKWSYIEEQKWCILSIRAFQEL